MARADLPPGAAAECLADVESAAQIAAGLCQQMLAYAGRAPFVAEPLELGAVVREMVQLLRSSLSHRVGLELELATGLPLLTCDPSQLRQVVLNLVINAVESIGEADGNVTVRTGREWMAAERLRGAVLGEQLVAGDYLFLEVSDTGCGMDEQAQRRIFEPFFTSKFAGRGLGLSAVLGVVRKVGGAIELESEPGRGTRFRVVFPATEAPAAPAPTTRAGAAWTGSGLVLVVDDEGAVRRALARTLRRLGFDVAEAASGAEGLELYAKHAGAVRAVILDLTMPGIDGVETLRRLRELDERAFVVIASGYAEAEVEKRFRGESPNGFLQKPFAPDALRRALAAANDGA
jgi:CheY-like chemotaxis protein